MSPGLALAIDVGGTSVRAALVRDGELLDRLEHPSGPDVCATIVQLARSLARGRDIAAIGVGVPEYVEAGRVTSTEVVAWDDSVVADLGEIAPVTVEADVRCGAIAEWAQSPGSLLYVSWGTGISSSLVLPDGSPWAGERGRAIALGERLIGGASLESLASGRGIETAFGSGASARELAGRDDAAPLFRRAGQLVADAVRDAALLLDPARVVIGGGLGTADTLARRTLEEQWDLGIPLSTAAHGADSGLVGAAIIALRR
ncbi:ROK family protein [Schumannella luteola]